MKAHTFFFPLVLLAFLTTSIISCTSTHKIDTGSIPVNTVIMADTKFIPETIRVSKGTTVTWHNLEDRTHNATANDNSWKSDDMGLGESKSVTFDKPGTYPYHCTHHTLMGFGMTGTVIVE
jgi:plastocyanin